ncbi:MAG: hypothetical protein PHS37_07275, partial [Candidatus Omnitrophica bacterium]|nr:hypothetical protein [Candidatus Omnitrophota bacterium]
LEEEVSDAPDQARWFEHEFGVFMTGGVWFGYFKHAKDQIVKYIEEKRSAGQKEFNVLIQAAANGEEAYSWAIMLKELFPDPELKFNIIGKDFLIPKPEEVSWFSEERLPKELRAAADKYFDVESVNSTGYTGKQVRILSLKKGLLPMVAMRQGDMTKRESIEQGMDIVIATRVLYHAIKKDDDISASVENVWASLKDGGLFVPQVVAGYNERMSDMIRGLFAGKFSKINDSVYVRIAAETAAQTEAREPAAALSATDMPKTAKRQLATRDTIAAAPAAKPPALNVTAAGENTAVGDDGIKDMQGVVHAVVGNIADEERLADTLKVVLESYVVMSGKKLVIALEEGLGGADFKMTEFMKTLREWKEDMIRNEKTEERREYMKRQMERIIVRSYKDTRDFKQKLGDDMGNGQDTFIFAFTKTSGTAGSLKALGEAVRPVVINETGNGTNFYYPLAEVVALSLARELLKIDTGTLLKSLAENHVDIKALGIDSIADDPSKIAYLIFTIIPKIERYKTGEIGDRFSRLVKFLRSA